MAERVQFYLDECVDPDVAEGLRRRGVVVVTTREAGLLGSSDAHQLAFALTEGLVSVSLDADFIRLHSQGIPHAGIVYCSPDRGQIGYLIQMLTVVADVMQPAEFGNHVEFI